MNIHISRSHPPLIFSRTNHRSIAAFHHASRAHSSLITVVFLLRASDVAVSVSFIRGHWCISSRTCGALMCDSIQKKQQQKNKTQTTHHKNNKKTKTKKKQKTKETPKKKTKKKNKKKKKKKKTIVHHQTYHDLQRLSSAFIIWGIVLARLR